MPAITVLGIGNTVMTDDGAGVHVVRELERAPAPFPDVTYIDGGTISFELVPEIAAAEALIIVDAVRLGAPPGTLRTIEGDDLDAFLRGRRKTAHEVGVCELFEMATLMGALPRRRALVGIQFETVAVGEDLTDSVQAAVGPAKEAVLSIIERWHREG